MWVGMCWGRAVGKGLVMVRVQLWNVSPLCVRELLCFSTSLDGGSVCSLCSCLPLSHKS